MSTERTFISKRGWRWCSEKGEEGRERREMGRETERDEGRERDGGGKREREEGGESGRRMEIVYRERGG